MEAVLPLQRSMRRDSVHIRYCRSIKAPCDICVSVADLCPVCSRIYGGRIFESALSHASTAPSVLFTVQSE